MLADFRMKEFLSEKGFDGEMIRRILKVSVMSPYWGAFERGELTEEETLRAFASLDPEIEGELRRAYSSVEGLLIIRDYAIDLVRDLKAAGFGLYYLSNYSKKAYEECGASLAFMEFMDGGLLSFQVGLTKPDPQMYRLFLERFRLRPETCLFIDDTKENVDTAQSLGFQGHHFRSYDGMLERLEQIRCSDTSQ